MLPGGGQPGLQLLQCCNAYFRVVVFLLKKLVVEVNWATAVPSSLKSVVDAPAAGKQPCTKGLFDCNSSLAHILQLHQC